MPVVMENVACNLCGSTESSLLYELEDTLYHVPGEFALRRCLHCGLMYLSPRPTRESIAAYYPAQYSSYRSPVEEERFALVRWMRQRKLARRRRLIEQYSGQSQGLLLDVGCATGLFLHEMAQSGWQVTGVEPIASAASYARNRFGLDVFQGTLNEAPYEPMSFDVITFWDVLEHTFSPAQDLAQAAHLLRPGGLLALSVPNWDSLERRLFGRHWQGLDPPRHLYVFSRQTLTTLLGQAGFSVIDWVCFMPSYFSFIISLERWLNARSTGLSNLAHRLLNIPGMRLPFEPFFTMVNWLGKGSVISVFARKTTPSEGDNPFKQANEANAYPV